MKKVKELLGFCDICWGVFGSHSKFDHLERTLAEAKDEKLVNPWLWKYKFDWKKIKKDLDTL